MFTLENCINRINQILNYPAMSYTDIYHFFDQAISELNTSLKIKLPLVSTMVEENKIIVEAQPNVILLETGSNTALPTVTSKEDCDDTSKIYYNSVKHNFLKYDFVHDLWTEYNTAYGIVLDEKTHTRQYTQAVAMYATGVAYWCVIDEKRLSDFDLTEYMPEDWIILFLIPYVCFKTAVRDGNDGGVYSDEYIQGFQQLQTSYDIPNFVELPKVAHLKAYKPEVEKNIAALNIKIPTRAIYDTMKIGNSILADYGGFNSRGGWGL